MKRVMNYLYYKLLDINGNEKRKTRYTKLHRFTKRVPGILRGFWMDDWAVLGSRKKKST